MSNNLVFNINFTPKIENDLLSTFKLCLDYNKKGLNPYNNKIHTSWDINKDTNILEIPKNEILEMLNTYTIEDLYLLHSIIDDDDTVTDSKKFSIQTSNGLNIVSNIDKILDCNNLNLIIELENLMNIVKCNRCYVQINDVQKGGGISFSNIDNNSFPYNKCIFGKILSSDNKNTVDTTFKISPDGISINDNNKEYKILKDKSWVLVNNDYVKKINIGDIVKIGSNKIKIIKNDFGYAYDTNARDYMEDRFIINTNLCTIGDNNFYFYAIFDGHGGYRASEYAKHNLYKIVKKNILKLNIKLHQFKNNYVSLSDKNKTSFFNKNFENPKKISCKKIIKKIIHTNKNFDDYINKDTFCELKMVDHSENTNKDEIFSFIQNEYSNYKKYIDYIKKSVTDALSKSINQLDSEFLTNARKYNINDGSTIICSLLIDDILFVANSGDSRCAVFKDDKTIPMSEDHKPSRVDEQRRIEKSGGVVKYVYDVARVNGILAVSRSMGDLMLKKWVISDPEIKVKFINQSDKYLFLSSDGIYDVMSDKDILQFINNYNNKDNPEQNLNLICSNLIEESKKRGSGDNMSCILIKLN